MAFTQITGIAPNFRDYKNNWLKAYEPGTTTPKNMSDNDTGSPTVAKYELNADGFPVSSGGAIVIPHIDGDYDLWLFPTEAEADANDTTNAIRLADDIENYLTSSTVGDAIGGFVTYEFDTVTNAQNGQTIGGETVTLEVDNVIRIKERDSALFDVISGTGTANGENIIAHATLNVSFAMREVTRPSYKFAIQPDQVNGDDFLEIRNVVDDIQLVSIPDGTASGDAWTYFLPPDVRRDSHALIATAGTVGGSNDIDFRTSGNSDYALIQAQSTYQDELIRILFDSNPSRNDGTKKDGTGGGGLTPAEDVYAFDAAISIPSNRTSDPICFPALPVLFEQYIELTKRSTGVLSARFTPNVNDITITDENSTNTLGIIESDGITIGGRKKYSTDVTDIQAVNGSHELSIFPLALAVSTPVTYRLVGSGAVCAGRLRVVSIGSGGSGFGVRDVAFQSDGTTVTIQTIGIDNLVAQFRADIVLNSGILDLELEYTGGLGGTGKVQVSVDWDVRTA